MLHDKIMRVAREIIEKQEGVPAVAEAWMVRRAAGIAQSRHQVVVSVMVTTAQGRGAFEVWILIDLDTEEVKYI